MRRAAMVTLLLLVAGCDSANPGAPCGGPDQCHGGTRCVLTTDGLSLCRERCADNFCEADGSEVCVSLPLTDAESVCLPVDGGGTWHCIAYGISGYWHCEQL